MIHPSKAVFSSFFPSAQKIIKHSNKFVTKRTYPYVRSVNGLLRHVRMVVQLLHVVRANGVLKGLRNWVMILWICCFPRVEIPFVNAITLLKSLITSWTSQKELLLIPCGYDVVPNYLNKPVSNKSAQKIKMLESHTGTIINTIQSTIFGHSYIGQMRYMWTVHQCQLVGPYGKRVLVTIRRI